MSKRPFNKIRRLDKKQNVQGMPLQGQTQQVGNSREVQNMAPRLSAQKSKKIKIISDQTQQNEQNEQMPHKPSLGSKPNLFKGKREGGKLILNPNRNTKPQTQKIEQQSVGDVSKATPMGIKKRFNLGIKKAEKQRQNVVIEQQSGRFDRQDNQPQQQENNTLKRKPDMKIRRVLQKKQVSVRKKEEQVQESAVLIRDVQESRDVYMPSAPIQYRQIDIQPSAAGLSEARIDKQNKRTKDLRKLLNFQIDLYEQTMSLGSVTPYQIYINKIKGGFLINSSDQAFDETSSNSCQTLSLQFSDFTNQCPQDYSNDINSITNSTQQSAFQQFVLRIAPVVEELIKPADTITDPPIFLLAFRPTFKAFLKCPYPVFVYRSEQFNLDLVIIGQKLYIVQGEISSVLMVGKNIIAGLRNGYIVLWNGTNNKGSRLYQQIKEYTQSTNFQLPCFITHQLQRFSTFASHCAIVGLLGQERGQFSSLDASGKLVRWTLQHTISNTEVLKPLRAVELKNLTQHWSLEAYSVKKRNDRHYVSTSLGILCLSETQIVQRLDTGLKPISLEVPLRSPLVYVVTQGNTLMVYNQLYSQRLLEMNLQIGNVQIKQMMIPHIDHQNRQVFNLSVLYLVDAQGSIYQAKLLQNRVQFVSRMGEQSSSDRNVLFRGVNRVGGSLQTVSLMRDFKVKSSFVRMRVNVQKSIANLKQLVQANRQLMTLLQGENLMVM